MGTSEDFPYVGVRDAEFLRFESVELQAFALRPDVIQTVVGFKVNGQLLDVLPYILTVIILAGFVGKAVPPRAGGEPYVKER